MNKSQVNLLRSIVILKSPCDLLLSLGGPCAVVRHAGGVNWRGGKKSRVKGVTSALSEIWARAIFHSVPFSIKEDKSRKTPGKDRKGFWRGRAHTPTRARTHTEPFSVHGSVSIRGACTLVLPSCAGACVCLQVFERVPAGARQERARIKPRDEAWWTIQAVVRHKWWVVLLRSELRKTPCGRMLERRGF